MRTASGPRRRLRTSRSPVRPPIDITTASTAYPGLQLHRMGCRSRGRARRTRRAVPARAAHRRRSRSPDRRRRGAGVGLHRRVRRGARRRRRPAGRRPRAAGHDAHRVGGRGREPATCPAGWCSPTRLPGRPVSAARATRAACSATGSDAWSARPPSGATPPRPDRVPVWAPYLRGERSPINNPGPASGPRRARPHARRGRGAARGVRSVGVRRAARDRRDTRRARLRAAADHRIGWRHPRRRLAPGDRRRDGPAGRLRRGARRRRAGLGVAGADGGRTRGADGDERRAAMGTCGPHGGADEQTGWSRWPSVTSGSAG